jgi:hypothetical protein
MAAAIYAAPVCHPSWWHHHEGTVQGKRRCGKVSVYCMTGPASWRRWPGSALVAAVFEDNVVEVGAIQWRSSRRVVTEADGSD